MIAVRRRCPQPICDGCRPSFVVDAGLLIALFRRRDKHHAQVKTAISTTKTKLVSTLPVVAEASHFLNADGKVALLTWVRRGALTLYSVTSENLADIEVVIKMYADRDIDFADATLICFLIPGRGPCL